MDEQERKVYEDVIDEQAIIIRNLEATLDRHRLYAKIVAAKGRATAAKNKERRSKGKQHYFVKTLKTINQKALRDRLFSSTEQQLLFNIIPFIGFDGMVANEDKSLMTVSEVEQLCGWSKSTNIKTINSLVDKQVLEKVKNGRIVHLKVSPDYYKCG